MQTWLSSNMYSIALATSTTFSYCTRVHFRGALNGQHTVSQKTGPLRLL